MQLEICAGNFKNTSMPANQNRVAFVRGPENLMLELIEA